MYKRFVFDGLYFQRYVSSILYPYLGPSAFSNNYSYLLLLIANQVLSTTTDFHKEEIYREFMQYGIAEAIAEEPLIYLYNDLKRCFKTAIGDRMGVNVFDVNLLQDNIIVEDCGVAIPRATETLTEDNWDWMPQHCRG